MTDQYAMALQTMQHVPASTKRTARNAQVLAGMLGALAAEKSDTGLHLDPAIVTALDLVAQAVRDSAVTSATQSLAITEFLDRPDLWEALNSG